MLKTRSLTVLSLLVLLAMVIGACAAPMPAAPSTEPAAEAAIEATEAPAEEAAAPATDIGSEANPIKVLFVPSVDAQVIVSGGEIMANALKEATGLNFEVSVPTSYAATIEEMCASPENSMGFIPGLGYVLANQLCGVDVAYKAVRFGNDVYWAQILVRDGDIQSLADLNGKKWAIPTPVRPRATWPFCPSLRKTASSRARRWKPAVTPAQCVPSTTVSRLRLVLLQSPLKPEGEEPWKSGGAPIPDDLIDSCAPSEDGSS
ncbi:MAG: PhnD/SsuA/transferrin family substrate-binding protein [Caldilineaceae bacterium]